MLIIQSVTVIFSWPFEIYCEVYNTLLLTLLYIEIVKASKYEWNNGLGRLLFQTKLRMFNMKIWTNVIKISKHEQYRTFDMI